MNAGSGETGLQQKSQRFWNCTYSFGYLLVYAVSLGLLYKIEHFDVSEPLFVLMVLGVGFSVLAWWTTRSVVPLPLDVKKPGQETMILLAYLVALAVFITWGLPAVGALAPTEPWKSVSILAAKLAALVVVPMVLFTDPMIWENPRWLPPSAWACCFLTRRRTATNTSRGVAVVIRLSR
jgi:hypothetical protein